MDHSGHSLEHFFLDILGHDCALARVSTETLRVPDFAIGNSSRVHFSLGGLPPPHTPRVAVGGLRPPTPLRKVGLRLPWALGTIWDGALGPMGPGPRWGLGAICAQSGFLGN